MLKALLALLLLVPAYALAGNGPFGFEPGMKLEELKKIAKLTQKRDFVYSTDKAPSGHSAFEEYRVLVTPQHGLCKIMAWTPEITTGAYGEGVKDKFDTLSEGLTAKYGKSKKFDYLKSGSIWDEPRDWMMSLFKDERVLSALWSRESGSELPDTLESVDLEATGFDSGSAMIVLSYYFRNSDACIDWIKAQENSAL